MGDVAGRGLDIAEVHRVVNYDLPATIDEYVHRVGRAGRAEKQGLAVSLFVSRGESENLDVAHQLFALLKRRGVSLPEGLEADVNARLAERTNEQRVRRLAQFNER